MQEVIVGHLKELCKTNQRIGFINGVMAVFLVEVLIGLVFIF